MLWCFTQHEDGNIDSPPSLLTLLCAIGLLRLMVVVIVFGTIDPVAKLARTWLERRRCYHGSLVANQTEQQPTIPYTSPEAGIGTEVQRREKATPVCPEPSPQDDVRGPTQYQATPTHIEHEERLRSLRELWIALATSEGYKRTSEVAGTTTSSTSTPGSLSSEASWDGVGECSVGGLIRHAQSKDLLPNRPESSDKDAKSQNTSTSASPLPVPKPQAATPCPDLRRVYVSKLPEHVTTAELTAHMAQAGAVAETKLLYNHVGKFLKCATIAYVTAHGAAEAVNTLPGSQLGGQQIFVRYDKEPATFVTGKLSKTKTTAKGSSSMREWGTGLAAVSSTHKTTKGRGSGVGRGR